ncbi:MAG: Fe-S cluster assembly sulfur transfer protein SufU [Gemmatimonadales bacterium]
MATMDELYQNVILEHNRSPRNYRVMEDASGRGEGNNPLCGDQIAVWLKIQDGIIQDASFQGSGCAISKASASLMTAAIKGKSREEALRLFDRFHALVTGRPPTDATETLGKLAVFSGVSAFPIRVKCATLSWHAMKEAMATQASQ